MTSCYHHHFQGYNEEEWSKACKSENLELSWQSLPSKDASGRQAPFMVERFHHLLLKWIAVDDQVVSLATAVVAWVLTIIKSLLMY